ncbi:MAG: hypothetical protein GEU68_15320 [Actinobacteria bacterium]|nr:hypothetical protein [Actinomycetota bacterium]
MTMGDISASAITELVERILDGRAAVAVLGQGYVGLSLACEAAERGFALVGIDIDEDRVGELRGGPSQGSWSERTSILDGRFLRAPALRVRPRRHRFGRGGRDLRADPRQGPRSRLVLRPGIVRHHRPTSHARNAGRCGVDHLSGDDRGPRSPAPGIVGSEGRSRLLARLLLPGENRSGE